MVYKDCKANIKMHCSRYKKIIFFTLRMLSIESFDGLNEACSYEQNEFDYREKPLQLAFFHNFEQIGFLCNKQTHIFFQLTITSQV